MMTIKFLINLLLLCILFGCNPEEKVNLTGKWKVSSVQLTEVSKGISTGGLVSELESMEFEFKEDGLNLHSEFFRQGVMGSWSLTPGEDSLICKYLHNRSEITDSYAISGRNENYLLSSSGFQGVNLVEIEITQK